MKKDLCHVEKSQNTVRNTNMLEDNLCARSRHAAVRGLPLCGGGTTQLCPFWTLNQDFQPSAMLALHAAVIEAAFLSLQSAHRFEGKWSMYSLHGGELQLKKQVIWQRTPSIWQLTLGQRLAKKILTSLKPYFTLASTWTAECVLKCVLCPTSDVNSVCTD